MPHLFKSLVVLGLLSAPAFASSGDASFRTAALPTQAVDEAPAQVTLADQIGRIIAMRTAMVDHAVPQPAADCADPQDVMRRVTALRELDTFARATVAGLIDAAPSSDVKVMTSERLTPVLLRHKAEMSAALDDLMNLPLVREEKALAADVARLAEQAARP